jgi:hypothetical protein
MRKYLGMNMLEKIRVGFVLQKRGKKRGINAGKQRREGGFWHERTQNEPSFAAQKGKTLAI